MEICATTYICIEVHAVLHSDCMVRRPGLVSDSTDDEKLELAFKALILISKCNSY